MSDSVLADVAAANAGREPKRVRLKFKRMAADPFAFFRGSAGLFAQGWAALRPPDPGPELLICGDLHLENFGAYRDDRGAFLFDINDFDEALVAPCSVDLVRCGASILLASELWGLSPLQANGMVLGYLDAYWKAITTEDWTTEAGDHAIPVEGGPVSKILGKTALGSQAELLGRLTERGKGGVRRIARSKTRRPEVDPDRAEQVREAVGAYGEALGRGDFFRPIDVTGRVAGIGSLGVERYLVLVHGGGTGETHRLLDLKAELPSAMRPCATNKPGSAGNGGGEATRVVRAQRTLQARPPALLDVLPVGLEDLRVRELIPEENRSSLDRLQRKPQKLREAVDAAGRLTGLAHRRAAHAPAAGDRTAALTEWASGAALDSVLASASRYAEQTRLAHRRFRVERRDPDALPDAFRKSPRSTAVAD